MDESRKHLIERFSRNVSKEFTKQQDFAFELEDLLAVPGIQDHLRISQIDLVDILATPQTKATEIETLRKEYQLDVKGNPPDMNSQLRSCLLYTSPSPRDRTRSRMPSSA